MDFWSWWVFTCFYPPGHSSMGRPLARRCVEGGRGARLVALALLEAEARAGRRWMGLLPSNALRPWSLWRKAGINTKYRTCTVIDFCLMCIIWQDLLQVQPEPNPDESNHAQLGRNIISVFLIFLHMVYKGCLSKPAVVVVVVLLLLVFVVVLSGWSRGWSVSSGPVTKSWMLCIATSSSGSWRCGWV